MENTVKKQNGVYIVAKLTDKNNPKNPPKYEVTLGVDFIRKYIPSVENRYVTDSVYQGSKEACEITASNCNEMVDNPHLIRKHVHMVIPGSDNTMHSGTFVMNSIDYTYILSFMKCSEERHVISFALYIVGPYGNLISLNPDSSGVASNRFVHILERVLVDYN